MRSREAQLIDPIAVQDIYVSGIGRVEDVGGGCIRITFYAAQKAILDGTAERVVVARLVGPASAAMDALAMTEAAINGKPMPSFPKGRAVTH